MLVLSFVEDTEPLKFTAALAPAYEPLMDAYRLLWSAWLSVCSCSTAIQEAPTE